MPTPRTCAELRRMPSSSTAWGSASSRRGLTCKSRCRAWVPSTATCQNGAASCTGGDSWPATGTLLSCSKHWCEYELALQNRIWACPEPCIPALKSLPGRLRDLETSCSRLPAASVSIPAATAERARPGAQQSRSLATRMQPQPISAQPRALQKGVFCQFIRRAIAAGP